MSGNKLTPEQMQRIKDAVNKVPYAQLLGIEVDEVDKGSATLGLNIRHELMQINGVVHGGAIASLIDTATAFAIIPFLEPNERVTTVDLTISYLRPLTAGRITATGQGGSCRTAALRSFRPRFMIRTESLPPQHLAPISRFNASAIRL